MSDQVPELGRHELKDLVEVCTSSCTVAIPCKPQSHRMEECCNLELLNPQKGNNEAWVVRTDTNSSKCNFKNFCDNEIQSEIDTVQVNEPEMEEKEDTRIPVTGLVSAVIHFVMYILLFLLLTHHLDNSA